MPRNADLGHKAAVRSIRVFPRPIIFRYGGLCRYIAPPTEGYHVTVRSYPI